MCCQSFHGQISYNFILITFIILLGDFFSVVELNFLLDANALIQRESNVRRYSDA